MQATDGQRPSSPDLSGSSGDAFFNDLKESTNVVLPAATCRRMYELALERGRSSRGVGSTGPARGA